MNKNNSSASSHQYNLPKPYLSYSAINKWLESPARFRKKYYENAPDYTTPELAFGKKIATLLENKDESMSHIRQLQKPEQRIDIMIDGVPIYGFIDSFDPDTKSFLEFKTGRQPWTKARVSKHLQLDLYSTAIEEMYGSVTDECMLIWMETEKIETPKIGLITHEESHGIRLTGVVKEFQRVITSEDRENMRTLLKRVAEEISDDYTEYQRGKRGLKPVVDN